MAGMMKVPAAIVRASSATRAKRRPVVSPVTAMSAAPYR